MSIVSGIFQASAATSAAKTQADAAEEASLTSLQATRETNALTEKMYNQGREDLAPWRETGANALTTLKKKIDTGPGEFTTSPGYAFRVGEGQKAIERAASSKGTVSSGSTMKALTRFGQDYATNDYQNFLANYYQSLTPYQSLAQIGQTTASQGATNALQAAGQESSNTISGVNASNNALMTAANATAQGKVNSANAVSQASSSAVNTAATALTVAKYLEWI